MAKRPGRIKVLLLLILIIGLSIGCSREVSSNTGKEEPVSQGSKAGSKWGNAPDFTLPKLGGGQLRLSSLKGKVIILDFWTTRCPHCVIEIPGFVELKRSYKDAGLEIVGVCLEDESIIKPFAKKSGINYTLVFANKETARQYGGIQYIPTTFIIDRQGNIAKKHIGFVSKEVFEKEIKELLSKKAK